MDVVLIGLQFSTGVGIFVATLLVILKIVDEIYYWYHTRCKMCHLRKPTEFIGYVGHYRHVCSKCAEKEKSSNETP